MRKPSLLILSMLIFIVSSCAKNEVISNHPFLLQKDKNIAILFSDEHSIYQEGNYYDALLEMKKKHPESFNSINIIHTTDRDLIRHYDVDDFPTLLVLHNQDIVVRIEGLLETSDICILLENAIN